MTDRVRITDVSPRDGLQNEPAIVPTSAKARLVRLVAAAGVDEVEVTSFVSPRWVPQMGDAAELLAELASDKPDGVMYSVLVPNERGLDAALEANRRGGGSLIDKVSIFTAASETFCQRNINCGVDESLARLAPVVRRAQKAGLLVRGYLSCVIACPYERDMHPGAVATVAGRLIDLGIEELDLGDTIGAGTAASVSRMLEAVFGQIDKVWRRNHRTTLHLHDTFGHAARCVRAALDMGVRSFDGAVGGLGGCPFASTPERRAPGNLSMSLLVSTVEDAGFRTGVDRSRLAEAEAYATSLRGTSLGSEA
jgi:hydroxymethylglutaryl-CoA lyase